MSEKVKSNTFEMAVPEKPIFDIERFIYLNEWCFLFDQYFNQIHTLYPWQKTTQNQYKYNDHNKYGNSI